MEKTQKGFGAMGVFITILVIGVIGAAGWYMTHGNDVPQTASDLPAPVSSSATTTTTGAKSSTTAKSYFTIKEWGLRAPYDGSLTLQYALANSADVALSSAQLAAGGPDVCTDTQNGEAGILGKYAPTDKNLGPGVPSGENAQQYIKENSTVPHVVVGSSIYIYWGTTYISNGIYTGPCADKAIAKQTIDAFAALVPQLQPIQ